MTNDEAKFLLQAYRAGGHDAQDPRMEEALDQAKRDPVLATWLRAEQAHAGAVGAKLRDIAPPAHLRDAILSGGRASRGAPRNRWWRFARYSLAAAVALVLGSVVWWSVAPVPGATLEEFAVNFVARRFLLQERSSELAELKAWLSVRGSPVPGELPPAFAALRRLGCRKVEFEGRQISLLCFERNGKEFHVFVARREDFPNRPFSAEPLVKERRGQRSVAWSDSTYDYVLVSDASREEVQRIAAERAVGS